MADVILHCYDCGPGAHTTDECPMRRKLRHPDAAPLVPVILVDGRTEPHICQSCKVVAPGAYGFLYGKVICRPCYKKFQRFTDVKAENVHISTALGQELDDLANHWGLTRAYYGLNIDGSDNLEPDSFFRKRIEFMLQNRRESK